MMYIISVLCVFVSFVYLSFHLLFYKSIRGASSPVHVLPPGKAGWPVIGETLEFICAGRKGHPEKFVMERMAKYSRDVFRTHLLGETAAVVCGASGNKFLFSNENKLVRSWWPRSADRVLAFTQTSCAQEATYIRKMIHNFLKPESLQRYVGIMDELTERHFTEKWEKEERVVVLPLTKQYTFVLACRLFLSIEDSQFISEHFTAVASALLSLPINLPGTTMYKGIKAANLISKHIVSIIRQRKTDLAQGKASPAQDILSHLLSASTSTDDDHEISERGIAANIIGLLVGGHDTTSTACTFVVKYLAELPQVYEAVRKEQMEIAKSKAPGELLNWVDLQKMKYSWNVACEVLRLAPPVQGTFREAIADFTYEGYSIPKGWKLYWTVHSTHKNPEVFLEPEKFNPSRFEGSGPKPYTFVPFGGGPRMCLGKEYARVEILVFMHHLVKRFKWEKIIPNEQIVVDPLPVPANGLPVRLFPHKG